ncbi:uncharacterized protein B0P05DRAFT_529458 [Gilbertella persicaria]|uniref:uncharacterized protein n=1 Tax=Gilbertella persicaria TaxID=101096 RepID=UPI00221F732C|nr:uncharacterized protein B0P05DRAFT_529458 [Gilbertella persicaria]KAI8090126.1 hypothetical protein B0P05DRAFT_529458 [Gilbertella persicaria]
MNFLNLTCNLHENDQEQETISTHDAAEFMIYAHVDSFPSVADLLWSKQQLGQGEFLKLTAEQEWSELPSIVFSTHEPLQ